MGGQAQLHRAGLGGVLNVEHGGGWHGDAQPTAGLYRLLAYRDHRRVEHVKHALAVPEHRGIKVDQLTQALGHAVGHAGDGVAPKAVADQHHLVQVLPDQHIGNVVHKGVERDGRRHQMRALAATGLRRREDRVAMRPETVGNLTPAPAAMEGAVHQHKCPAVAHLNALRIHCRYAESDSADCSTARRPPTDRPR